MKEQLVEFSEREQEQIKRVAELRGISLEDAATQLFSEGMEARYRKKTGKGPANNVRRFRKR